MCRRRPPYPAEFRENIATLHRSGRSIASLARAFEHSESTILSWVRAAPASTSGSPSDGELDWTE
jgi:transposase